ncbi:hypothetical protein B7H17_22745 [Pseudomonas putida]|uniref:Uncharacterized protein n=1 Tax=Pseudomonas putida TaxID=303 RepID=A0A1X0ZPA7_PSEPU|nr:hypothetical protein B7H17_22745 [Pseudomonas putida]
MPFSRIYEVFNVTRYCMLFAVACLYLTGLVAEWAEMPATILAVIIFWQRCRCVYISDSYSHFCSHLMFHLLFIFLFIFGVSTFSTGSEKWDRTVGSLLLLASVLLTALTYFLVSRLKIAPMPYEIRDGRVHVAPRKETYVPPVWTAMGTLGGGAVIPLMDEYPTVTLVISMTMPAIVVMGAWRTVAGLAHLRAEERRKGVRYTFSNLEEIQAIRARSWAARLFIAFKNLVSRQR